MKTIQYAFEKYDKQKKPLRKGPIRLLHFGNKGNDQLNEQIRDHKETHKIYNIDT